MVMGLFIREASDSSGMGIDGSVEIHLLRPPILHDHVQRRAGRLRESHAQRQRESRR